jgi:hypothetical protein
MKIPKRLLETDVYLKPSIRMTPFYGKVVYENSQDKYKQAEVIETLSSSLFKKDFKGSITSSARESISLILDKIVNNDKYLICIITPSSSGYVSSCVTDSIKKKCKYVINYTPDADAYFFIHEFGRHVNIAEYNIDDSKIIIEDCAYALVDKSSNYNIGMYSNYVIFSLSKAFGIQYGGILFHEINKKVGRSCLEPLELDYLISYLKPNIRSIKKNNYKRKSVYSALQKSFKKYNIYDTHRPKEYETPYAFFVNLKNKKYDKNMKVYLNSVGIESSFFYGGNAYFLPCHHLMTQYEIEYITYHVNKVML